MSVYQKSKFWLHLFSNVQLQGYIIFNIISIWYSEMQKITCDEKTQWCSGDGHFLLFIFYKLTVAYRPQILLQWSPQINIYIYFKIWILLHIWGVANSAMQMGNILTIFHYVHIRLHYLNSPILSRSFNIIYLTTFNFVYIIWVLIDRIYANIRYDKIRPL